MNHKMTSLDYFLYTPQLLSIVTFIVQNTNNLFKKWLTIAFKVKQIKFKLSYLSTLIY